MENSINNYPQADSNQNCDDKPAYAFNGLQESDAFNETLVTSKHTLYTCYNSKRTNSTDNNEKERGDDLIFFFKIYSGLANIGLVPRQSIKCEDYCHIKNSPPNKFTGHDAIARIFLYLGFEKQCVAVCLRYNILYVAYDSGIKKIITTKIYKALKSKTETELYNYILSECKANSKINEKLKGDKFLQNLFNDCKESYECLKSKKVTLQQINCKDNLLPEMALLQYFIENRILANEKEEEEAIYIGFSYLRFRGTHCVLNRGFWACPHILKVNTPCDENLINLLEENIISQLHQENQQQVYENVINLSQPFLNEFEEHFGKMLSPKGSHKIPINLNHDQSDDNEYTDEIMEDSIDNYPQPDSNQNCADKPTYALNGLQRSDIFIGTLVTNKHSPDICDDSKRTNSTDTNENKSTNDITIISSNIKSLMNIGLVPEQFIERKDWSNIKNSPSQKGLDAIARVLIKLSNKKKCAAVCLNDGKLYIAYNKGIEDRLRDKIKKALNCETKTEFESYILSECKAYLKIGKKLENKKLHDQLVNDCKKCYECLKSYERLINKKIILEPIDNAGNLHAEMALLQYLIKNKFLANQKEEEEAIYIGISFLCCVLCKVVLDHYSIRFRGTHGVLYCGKSWPHPGFLTESKSLPEEIKKFLVTNLISHLQQVNPQQVFGNVMKLSKPILNEIEKRFGEMLPPKGSYVNPINLNHDQSDDDEYNEPK